MTDEEVLARHTPEFIREWAAKGLPQFPRLWSRLEYQAEHSLRDEASEQPA